MPSPMRRDYMRREIIGSATLYLGDCREVREHLADDLHCWNIVTDPPYGIGYRGRSGSKASISTTGKRSTEAVYGDGEPFEPALWLEHPCAFTGAQHFHERLPGGSFHVWNKRGPYKPLVQSDGDLIWISGPKRPLRIVDLVWRGICRTTENTEPIVHPTQKPVALMEWIIRELLAAEEMATGPIVDPYMGSGTTGVAAINCGEPFIGIEAVESHFTSACQRIERVQRQVRLA